MLNVHNLSVAFQGEYLFEGITFQLTGGDRVGLVGKNGAGKSTLLRIISGEQEYDTGQIATGSLKLLDPSCRRSEREVPLTREPGRDAHESMSLQSGPRTRTR